MELPGDLAWALLGNFWRPIASRSYLPLIRRDTIGVTIGLKCVPKVPKPGHQEVPAKCPKSATEHFGHFMVTLWSLVRKQHSVCLLGQTGYFHSIAILFIATHTRTHTTPHDNSTLFTQAERPHARPAAAPRSRAAWSSGHPPPHLPSSQSGPPRLVSRLCRETWRGARQGS